MELPPSAIDPDDYPRGPNGMALLLEARLSELEAQKRECRTQAERRPINQALHQQRDLLRWVKPRAGYVETPADLGLDSDRASIV